MDRQESSSIVQPWWKSSVVYQIYPRSFMDNDGDGIGDLRGIIRRLDHLQDLGIDVIWLSPVFSSPMKDNGYDISDYQDVAPEFGTLQDLRDLIREARLRGIRILLDLVLNHTSDQHPWFREARTSTDNPKRDWYIWRKEPDSRIRSVFGGEAWTRDPATGEWYMHLFAPEQPDLNWEHPEVPPAIFSMINWWLDQGVGGFRLDVIDLIGKEPDRAVLGNGPRLHPLLQRMNRETFGRHDVLTVGETWGATPEIAIQYSHPDRHELSMVFQFEHMVLDWGPHGKWTPRALDLVRLKEVLAKWQQELAGKGWNSLFWNNHDLPRIVSRWGDDGVWRRESAGLLGMILHGLQGTPYIYQGEEIGMTNLALDRIEDYNDVEIHRSYQDLVVDRGVLSAEDFMTGVRAMGRDNARTPMQWDAGPQAGFSSARPWLPVNPAYRDINVEADRAHEKSVFNIYQSLVAFRKSADWGPVLTDGDFTLIEGDHPRLFAYTRSLAVPDGSRRTLLVLGNFGSEPLLSPRSFAISQVLLSTYADPWGGDPGVELRPWEAVWAVLD